MTEPRTIELEAHAPSGSRPAAESHDRRSLSRIDAPIEGDGHESATGGVLAVHFGESANCSSIGSFIDFLFLSSAVGAAALAAVASALGSRHDDDWQKEKNRDEDEDEADMHAAEASRASEDAHATEDVAPTRERGSPE